MLARYRSENNFVIHQNNYAERLNVNDNITKGFNILTKSV